MDILHNSHGEGRKQVQMRYQQEGHLDPMIGNGEDTVSSWVQMFNSICEGDDEWALAERSLLLDDCRTVEGQA